MNAQTFVGPKRCQQLANQFSPKGCGKTMEISVDYSNNYLSISAEDAHQLSDLFSEAAKKGGEYFMNIVGDWCNAWGVNVQEFAEQC